VEYVEKKYLVLVIVVVLASILSILSVVTLAYTQKSNGVETPSSASKIWVPLAWNSRFRKAFGWGARGLEVVISDEFKQKVVSILQKDSNVATLLNQGYNITNIKPIVTMIVGGDGSVTFRATKAIAMLCNGNGGRAVVYVDVEGGKVLAVYKFEAIVKTTASTTSSSV
jgi:hypothetical protein